MVQTKRLSVGFLLAPGFTISAFATFVDILRLAADEHDRSRPILCNWTVLSSDMKAIKSSSGVSVSPDEPIGDPSRFDYIVVVGGLLHELVKFEPRYIEYLHLAARSKVPLVGLCTGAFVLHNAGLMEGYRCCVSWFHHDDFLEQFEGIKPVSDQIYVVDRDRLTCSGGVSAAHLAAFLVDRHIGRSARQKSLHIMIIDDAHDAEDPQPGIPNELVTKDILVRRALLRMQQSLENPLSIQDLAKLLSVSRSKLERRFILALSKTPKQAYLEIRLTRAKHLLEHSQNSILSIAQTTGFCDSSHFSRAFQTYSGKSPSVHRASCKSQ